MPLSLVAGKRGAGNHPNAALTRDASHSDFCVLAKEFQTQSQTDTTLISSIDRSLHSTAWTGGFHEDFQNKWEHDFKTALNKLKASLEEAGKVVHGRRDAIDVATKR